MTFCLGMKVSQGLVGIADTRITSGTECITSRKVTVHHSTRSLADLPVLNLTSFQGSGGAPDL